jgi:hypothetical protein
VARAATAAINQLRTLSARLQRTGANI